MSVNQKVWAQQLLGWVICAGLTAIVTTAVLNSKLEAAQGEIRELRNWRSAHEEWGHAALLSISKDLSAIKMKLGIQP